MLVNPRRRWSLNSVFCDFSIFSQCEAAIETMFGWRRRHYGSSKNHLGCRKCVAIQIQRRSGIDGILRETVGSEAWMPPSERCPPGDRLLGTQGSSDGRAESLASLPPVSPVRGQISIGSLSHFPPPIIRNAVLSWRLVVRLKHFL